MIYKFEDVKLKLFYCLFLSEICSIGNLEIIQIGDIYNDFNCNFVIKVKVILRDIRVTNLSTDDIAFKFLAMHYGIA